MKKLISITLVCLLVISLFSVGASAEVKEVKLPFELIPSKTVSMDKTEGDSDTTMNFTYSMENDMIQFLQKMQDGKELEKWCKENGLGGIYVNAQVDWAIDDPNDWHHNEFWDDNAGTRLYGIGYDSEGRVRTCEWDDTEVILGIQTTNETWIMRSLVDPDNPEDYAWNGEDYGNGIKRPGLKDVLKQDQYSIVRDENGARVVIDYDKHTAYARMRYMVSYYVPKYDELGTEVGGEYQYVFSDWSDTAAYGKEAAKWTPPTADTAVAPEISNLRVDDELFNDYPIVDYDLYVPTTLSIDITEIAARGGYVIIETEARVKGTSEWTLLQGDNTVKSGMLYSDVLQICGAGKPIPKGCELEFRARYLYDVRESQGGEQTGYFYSPYSNVLTVTFEKDYGTAQPADEQPATQPAVEQPAAQKPSAPAAKPEPKISSLSGKATKTQVNAFVKSLKTDGDPKGSTFGILSAKQKKAAKNSISISWNKVKGAKSYVIYANKCGKKYSYNYLATVSKTGFTQKKLQKGTYYKYLVAAFDSGDKLLATAKTLHIATKGGKNGNFKKVTTAAKKDKVTLAKKGKSFKLRAKAIPESKKNKVSVHRKMKYESSDPKVASVNSSGKITAKKKGSCVVYAYAQSGAYKKIKVTVKK